MNVKMLIAISKNIVFLHIVINKNEGHGYAV
jgi:hypothetical protein